MDGILTLRILGSIFVIVGFSFFGLMLAIASGIPVYWGVTAGCLSGLGIMFLS